MLILKIKQAECALHDGRLDEAYAIARDEQVKSHRNGQRLITRLTDALIARGKEHLSSERPQDAMADCAKAERLAGNSPQIATFRNAVVDAINAKANGAQRAQQAVADAQRHLQQGELSLAGDVAASLDDSRLKKTIEQQRTVTEKVIVCAAASLERGDLTGATQYLIQARTHGGHQRLDQLAASLLALLTKATTDALVEGDINVASHLLQQANRIDRNHATVVSLNTTLQTCRDAQQLLAKSDFRTLRTKLARIQSALPHTAWVRQMSEAAEQAIKAVDSLALSPLAEALAQPSPELHDAFKTNVSAPPAMQYKVAATANANTDHITSMQIEGMGAYLIVTAKCVSLGPISTSRKPDICLAIDPALPVITIKRNDEDYFIEAASPIQVDQKQTTRALLLQGTKISLGHRCSFQFNKPHTASATATLELCSGRFASSDAKTIILMDSEFIIDNAHNAHIKTTHSQNIVIANNRGHLHHRTAGLLTQDTLHQIDGLAIHLAKFIGGNT